jgi:uncharacterized repeat protein (TIGR01451 family)
MHSRKKNSLSCKLRQLLLLSGGLSMGYSLLAAIAPSNAWAGDLEFSVGSYPGAPNGPALSAGPATLLENTSGSIFVPYTPATTIGISISNQQYAGGLQLGTIGAASPVFNKLNFYGGPTDAMFTSNPNGTAGTGVIGNDNYAYQLYASVQPLIGLPNNARYYYGDVTLTFNHPVSDPVVHMSGMGGNSTLTATTPHGHSAEMELITPGIIASKLSGSNFLNVTGNKMLNSATTITASCATGAACGSVKFAGTNITSLTFKVYVRGDAGTAPWSGGDVFLFGGTSIAKPVTISGTVFDDANGLTDSLINGTGSNTGGLFANLVDTNGKVIASTAVAANGTYSFLGIGAGQYTVSLSTTAGIQGSIAPPTSLPATWSNTGEGTAAAGDGLVDGKTSLTVAAANLSGVNFGIQQQSVVNQPPDTTPLNPPSQPNPGGTATVQVPTLAGTDPEDGLLGLGKSFKIESLPTNGTLSYNNVPVLVGQIISNYDPTLLKLDPDDGAITVSFTYAAIDSANQSDRSAATVTMAFTSSSFVNGTCQADGLLWVSGSSGQISNYRVSNQAFTTVSNGTGKVWGDIAWGSDNKLYGATFVASPSLYQIDPATGASTPIASLSPLLRFPNAMSGLPDGSLLIGAASNAKVYRFDLSTPNTPPSLWHDFGAGDPSGDFILFNNKIYVAWRNAGTESLYEVTIDANQNYISHRNLGALPASSWGVALVLNKLYIASNTTIYRINGIPTDPIATIPVTVVNNTPYPLFGATGMEEPFGGCTPMTPNVLLVKRITAINNGQSSINGDNLAGYIDSPTNPYDDNIVTIPTQSSPSDPPTDTTKWPNPGTFLLGGINGGKTSPNDNLEYTIYFLSGGDAMAKNVLFCDRVPEDVSYIFNSFGGSSPLGLTGTEQGMQLLWDGTTSNLTNVPDGDVGQYFAPGIDPKATYPNINCRGDNTNGAVVVNLGNLPNATTPGIPTKSYGFIRFRGRVK